MYAGMWKSSALLCASSRLTPRVLAASRSAISMYAWPPCSWKYFMFSTTNLFPKCILSPDGIIPLST